MEFYSRREHPSEPHRLKAAEILAKCHANEDVYDSPSGIEVTVGDVLWTITYWPAWENLPERLNIERDTGTDEIPVSYGLTKEGVISKNQTIIERIEGGVYYDPAGERVVEDIDELEILKAIVMAAHELHRGT